MFALYPRLRAMSVPGYETAPDSVQMLPERLKAPLSWRRPRRVFVNSMSDLFHPHIEVRLHFGCLRRHGRSEPARVSGTDQACRAEPPAGGSVTAKRRFGEWPKNVWMGTSVESQKYAPRLTVLRRILSACPVSSCQRGATCWRGKLTLPRGWRTVPSIGSIAGGESGPRARPMDLDWARDLRDQSAKANVAFFLKQLGGLGAVSIQDPMPYLTARHGLRFRGANGLR